MTKRNRRRSWLSRLKKRPPQRRRRLFERPGRGIEALEPRLMLTTPYLTNLGLVNDTGTPGDNVTTDPRVGGMFEDSDMSGTMYLVEVDVDGDSLADDSVSTYPGNSFEYDPSAWVSYGPVTLSLRAVEDGVLFGSWESVSFTYEDPAGGGGSPISQVTSLILKNDTNVDGDLVTYDPRVIGQLDDPDGMGTGMTVEIDVNSDGTADDALSVNAGSSFEYNPAMLVGFGSVTIAARTTGYDPYTYTPVFGDWQSITYQFDSVLTEVSLATLNTSVNEGASATFAINRPADFDGTITVEAWPRTKGDATYPADPTIDFDETTTIGSAGSGSSSVNVSVPTNEDNIDEYDEEFEVEFHVSVTDLYYDTSTLGDLGVVTIVDNDTPPVLSLQRIDLSGNDTDANGVLLDNTVPEFDGVARFNVMFSHPSQKVIELTYGTQDGSALGIAGTSFNSTEHDEDFELFSGRLQQLDGVGYPGMIDFPGGTIEIPLNDDWWHEQQETFVIDLTSATNASLSTSSVSVTIDDDADDTPTAYVPDSRDVMEDDPLDLVVPINLSNPSLQTVTVDYATAASQTTPNATSVEDYVTTSGTVTFASGELLKDVTVEIVDDEPWRVPPLDPNNQPWWLDEFFAFKLLNPVNARLDGGIWFSGNDETAVRIIDEQSFPNMTVIGPASMAEGTTADFTFSFDQVFEETEVLNYDVYWDFYDHQMWQWFGGDESGICGGVWSPPTQWGELEQSGSITLTPTGAHDFTETISAPTGNGLHDPARFLRIVFDWENEDFYDPPTHQLDIVDDTPEPSITGFVFSPNTIYEDEQTLPAGRVRPDVDAIITLDNAWSIPQPINLEVDLLAGQATASDVELPAEGYVPYGSDGRFMLGIGQTSATFELAAVHDDPDDVDGGPRDETLVMTARATWNGSSATANGTIIDSANAPSSHHLFYTPRNAVFEIPADLTTGDYVGAFLVDGSHTSSAQVTSNTGPFSVTAASGAEYRITYDGTQPLIAGDTYTITLVSSDQWSTVTESYTINVTGGGVSPIFITPAAFEIVEGAGTETIVGYVGASDADRDRLEYALSSPPAGLPFAVDSETGAIQTTSGFTSTAGTSFSFDVVARDLATGSPGHRETIQPVSVVVFAPDRTINRAPVAVRDVAVADVGETITINVLANDRDPELGPLSQLQIATAPQNGTATIQGTSIEFTSQAGSTRGVETFSYSIQDDQGNQSIGTVSVMVGLAEDTTGQVVVSLTPEAIYAANPYLVSHQSYRYESWRPSLDRLEQRGIRWTATAASVPLDAYDAVLYGDSSGTVLSTEQTPVLPAPPPPDPPFGTWQPTPNLPIALVADFAIEGDPINTLITTYSGRILVDLDSPDVIATVGRSHNIIYGCDYLISEYIPMHAWVESGNARALFAAGKAIVVDMYEGNPLFPGSGLKVDNPLYWDTAVDWVTGDTGSHVDRTDGLSESYTFAVAAYVSNGTVVGSLPVSAQNSYIQTAGNTSIFSYNATDGEISVLDSTQLVPGARYELTFNIEAESTGIGTATATILVGWPNRAPSFDLPAGPFSLAENSEVGTVVGQVTATDPDPGTNLTYEITAGNTIANWTGDAFAVNTSSGEITVANRDALDFETTPVFTLTIRVSDDVPWNVLADTVDVTINLQDVVVDLDDANIGSIPENSPVGTVIGTIVPRDWPAVDTLTYSVLQVEDGNGNSYPTSAFQVVTDANGSDGHVEVVDPSILNYEAIAPGHIFRLSVQAEEGQSPASSDSAWFTFDLTDVNESPNDVVVAPDNIDENTDTAAGDVTVGQLSATDEDVNDTYSFSLIAGAGDADNNDFIIVGNELRIRQNVVLDYETKPQFQVRVQVFDGSNNFEKALLVLVNDLNETPTDIGLSPDNIDENTDTSLGDATIGTLSNVDQDTGNTYVYSLVGGTGDTDNGLFTIAGDQLAIKQGTAIDREVDSQFSLRVNVNDGVSNFAKPLTVTVNDLNDNPPVITPGQQIAIPEDALVNSLHGPIVYTDADTAAVNPPVTWSIVGPITGDDSVEYPGTFTIVPGTGEIQVLDNSIFDAENAALPQSFTFTVQVTDGVFSDQETVTVNITDANDNPPVVDPSQTIFVPEDAVNDSRHGPVTGSDPDVSDVLQNWQIVGDIYGDLCQIYNDIFTIVSETGEIKILDASQIDFDNSALSQTFFFDVTVSDGLHTSALESVTLKVTDLNDNAPVITPSQTFMVSEDAANGTAVGTVAATDVDTVGGPLQNWLIVAGNTDGVFQINSTTGEITVTDNANLDRETTGSYTLSLTVSDGLNTSATETVVIDISDVNDNAPVVTPGQALSVSEDAANGVSVGTVAATDADIVGGPLQGWAIVGGNTDGVFQINSATGEITIADNSNLDRETTDSYTLTLMVSDTQFTSASETITINVTDVNDNAPIVTVNQTVSIPENSANDSLHGPVAATDADIVGTLQGWQIVGDVIGDDSQVHNDVFTIVAATGEIKILDNTKLDYDNSANPKSYTFSVTVADGVHTSATETITVAVTDLNDVAPIIDTPVPTLSVSEDAAAGTNVGTLTATDPDTVGALQNWTILSGNDKGVFALNASTGKITIADPANLDYETQSTYSLDVQVSDGVNTSPTKTITIDIINVVEPPEISVRQQNGPLIVDGSSTVDFGETPVGTPVVVTFEITNHGDSNLDVLSFSVPAGYSLGAVTPTSSINPGAMSTFTVTLDAITPGTYSGEVSFANNDGNSDGLVEDPFNFNVTGVVASTAEIEVSYLEGGAFQSGGIIEFGSTFQGESFTEHLLVTNPGEEDLVITWPDPISVSGFSVTVPDAVPDGNGNQVLTVAPGSAGSLVTIVFTAAATGFFNETLPFPSNDFDEGDFSLQLIGRVKSTTLPGGEPAFTIIDNGDSGYTQVGSEWDSPQPVGYAGDYARHQPPAFGASDSGHATWSFSGLAAGNYRVSATWLPRHLREVESASYDGPAQYNIFAGDPDAGSDLLHTAVLNQRSEPDDFEFDNAFWEDIGTVYVDGSELSVRLYAPDNALGTRVTADAVRIEFLDINDDILRLPGGRAYYTFDVRDNDATGGVDPRAKDTNLTGLTLEESPKVQQVNTISGGGLVLDGTDPDLWVAPSGTTVRHNPDGTLTYTPADPFAPDVLSFDYTLDVDPTVVFSFRDHSPILHHDELFVSHGDSLTFDVRANDVDPQGDVLTATVDGVRNGRFAANGTTIIDASRLAIQAPEDEGWTLELSWDGGPVNQVVVDPFDDFNTVKSKIEADGGMPPGVQVETWEQLFEPRLLAVRFLNLPTTTLLEAAINPSNSNVLLHNRAELTANSDGTHTYTPNSEFFRAHGVFSEELRYVAEDSGGNKSAEPGLVHLEVINHAPQLTGLDHVHLYYDSSASTNGNRFKIPLQLYDVDGDQLELYPKTLTGSATVGTFEFAGNNGIMVEDGGVIFQTFNTGVQEISYRVFDGHSFSPIFSTQFSSLDDVVFPEDIIDGVPTREFYADGGINATGWTIDGEHVTSRQVTSAFEQIGSALVDLNAGTFQIAQPLDFDLRQTTDSDGQYQLVYNSDASERRPIIQGRIQRSRSAIEPASMDVTLKWFKVSDPFNADNYQLHELNEFQTTRTFNNLTAGLDAYLFSVQTPLDGTDSLVDKYGNGVYRWQIDADVTFDNSNSEVISIQGDALLVDDRSALANPHQGLPEDWGIGGLPALWVDLNNTSSVPGLGDHNQDNTAILVDPAGENTLYMAARFQPDLWKPVEVGTRTRLPKDLGALNFNDSNNEFTYSAVDGTVFTFRYDMPVGNDDRGFFAALREIDPVVGPSTTFNYHPDGRIDTITASDGSITTFVYAGTALTQIQLPGGRNLSITDTTLGGDAATQLAIGNYIRTVVYDGNNRVKSDINGTGTNQIETHFGYDAGGYLNAVTLGNAANGGTSTYSIRPAALFTQDVQGLPDAFQDATYSVAELIVPTGDLKKYDGTVNGADLGYDVRTYYKFDQRGRNFETSTYTTTDDGSGQHQLNGDPISANTVEWDHFDNVTHSTDTLGRTTRVTYDHIANGPDLLGQYYLDAFSTPPAGDVEMVFGNLTEVFRLYRQAAFDYDNDFGLVTDEIDAGGNLTRYFRDSKGLTHFVDGPAGYFEIYNYDAATDLPSLAIDTLGLTTTFNSYDANRRPTQQTIDDSSTGESRIITFDYSNPFIDKVTNGNGTVRNTIAFDFDELDRVVNHEILNTDSPSPTTDLLLKSSTEYLDNGLVFAFINGQDVRTEFDYDARGFVTSVIAGASSPLAETTVSTYYASGAIREQTAPDGTVTTSFFDPANYKNWDRTDRVWLVNSSDVPEFGEIVTTTTTDQVGNVTQVENSLTGQVTTFAYDPLDRLSRHTMEDVQLGISTTDKQDLITAYSYDALGNTRQVAASDTAPQVIDYDAFGGVTRTEISADGGAINSFLNDPAGHVVELTEHRITPTRNGNDIAYTMASYTSTYDYDQFSRLRTQTDPDGVASTYAYSYVSPDDHTRVTITDRNGSSIEQYLDGAGQLRKVVDAASGVTVYDYDQSGEIVSMTIDSSPTDPLVVDRETTYDYDDLGRLKEVTSFNPTQTVALKETTEYLNTVADGRKVVVTATNGSQTTYEYDALDKLIQITSPDPGNGADGTPDHIAPITQIEYKYVLPSGDTPGKVEVRTIDPELRRNITTQNTLGWVLSSTNSVKPGAGGAYPAATVLIDSLYDGAGRVLSQFDTDDNSTRFVYDLATGQPHEIYNIKITQGQSNTTPTEVLYDSAGRRVSLIDPEGNETKWTFDALGRIDSQEFTVDAIDLNTGAPTGATTGVTRDWEYDGLKTIYTDGVGDITVTTWTPGARTLSEAWFAPGADINNDTPLRELSLEYNAAAELSFAEAQVPGAATPDSSLWFGYDSFGRMNQTISNFTFDGIEAPTSRLDVTYHHIGQRNTVEVFFDQSPDVSTADDTLFSRTTSLVDNLGRVHTIKHDLASSAGALWANDSVGLDKSSAFKYHADGTRDSVTRYKALAFSTADEAGHSVYDYQDDGRPQGVRHFERPTSEPIAVRTNTYDGEGRLDTRLTIHYGPSSAIVHRDKLRFNYYVDGQLKRVDVENGANTNNWILGEEIAYDDNGNHAHGTVVGKNNHLLEDEKYWYRYDGEGRLTNRDSKPTRLVDNAELQSDGTGDYDEAGGWSNSFDGGYGGDERVTQVADAQALFHTRDVSDGLYEVWITWEPVQVVGQDLGTGRIDLYSVGDSQIDAQWNVDFSVAPSDSTDRDGVDWMLLGEYELTAAKQYIIQVKQVDQANPVWIVADAVRFIPAGLHETYKWDHRGRLNSVSRADVNGNVLVRIDYGYDAIDRRVGRAVYEFNQSTGQLERTEWMGQVFDGSEVIAEVNEDKAVTRSIFVGPRTNEVIAFDETSTPTTMTVWAFADLAGSIQSLGRIDGGGQWVVLHRDFDPNGNFIATYRDVADVALREAPVVWASHTLDPKTGLYDAEARWLDSHSGRFITEDPSGFAGGDTNLFRYGLNSPTNFADPNGQAVESLWDLASLGVGIWSLTNSIKEGDVAGATIDAVGIVLDTAALLIPFVPGGAGVAIKAIRGAEAARKAAGALQKAKRFTDIAKNTVRAADFGLQLADTGAAIKRGDSLGAALGATGLGIRGLQGIGTARRAFGRAPDVPRSATELPLLPVVNPRFDISDELLEARGLTRACFTPGHEIQVPRQDEGIASLPAAVSEIESGTLDEHLATLLAVGLISASAVYGINAAVRTAKNKKRQYETSADELFAQLSNEQLTWS